jgi:exonuclease VII large subunit
VRNVANEAPTAATKTVENVRHKLIVELEAAIRVFERTFDEKATEGRQLVDSLKQDTRVNRFLDQSESTRSQLKAALTSLTKTVDVAAGAARKQADTASSQVKGAVTSVGRTVDVATEAAKKQADTAVTQVKAAATSVRRSAETVGDAAEAATAKVDEAS